MNARNADFSIFEARYQPEPNTGCWLWTHYSPNGRYGSLKWLGKRVLAHVFSYEWHVGPVPKGMELDHKCRTPFCVNPAHLEPVSHEINMARSAPATKIRCHRGHLYADGMEIYSSKTHRYRRCLTCYRMKWPGTKK